MSNWAFLIGCGLICSGLIFTSYQLTKIISDIPMKMLEFLKIYAKANKVDVKIGDSVDIGAQNKFFEQNKTRESVITLPSGLQYEVMIEGGGEKPKLKSKVKVHYHGTRLDGTVFDSSVQRGSPASLKVSGVIPGWTEALQLMPQGSKWKLFIPPNLAYGNRNPGGGIGSNAALIFEVELLEVN